MSSRLNHLRAGAALTLLSAALLAACAGSEAPVEPLAAKRAAASSSTDATVYVVHGINGTDLGAAESLPVDVSVNGACALTALPFRQIAGPLSLPAGPYDIQVRLASVTPCDGPIAIDAPGVLLAAGTNSSIVAHLTETGTPTASVFENDIAAVPGRARLIARHTAAFGAVDVLLNGSVAFASVTNGQQGSAVVRPGRSTVVIAPAGTDIRAWEATLALRPFVTYAAYAVGTPANGTFEVLLQTFGN